MSYAVSMILQACSSHAYLLLSRYLQLKGIYSDIPGQAFPCANLLPSCPSPPFLAEQAVMPTPQSPLGRPPPSTERGDLVYHTMSVLRMMTKLSLASGDEAEGRQDTVREAMERGLAVGGG